MDLTKLTLQLCMFVCLVTKVTLDSFVILWTVACQAPLSLGFSRKGDWSGLPCPLSGDCSSVSWGLKVMWLSCIKNLPTKAGDARDMGFNPWVRKILWRRKWQPSPVFLPGKSHGQRNLVGYSPWDCKELDVTEHTHMLGSANSSAPAWGLFTRLHVGPSSVWLTIGWRGQKRDQFLWGYLRTGLPFWMRARKKHTWVSYCLFPPGTHLDSG